MRCDDSEFGNAVADAMANAFASTRCRASRPAVSSFHDSSPACRAVIRERGGAQAHAPLSLCYVLTPHYFFSSGSLESNADWNAAGMCTMRNDDFVRQLRACATRDEVWNLLDNAPGW